MIEIGMTYTMEKTVTPDMTAKAVGSGGLEVFGTPFMMGLMENAAMQCVQPELPEGKGTVGVEISSSHLAPTPVGMKVSATAEVHRRADHQRVRLGQLGSRLVHQIVVYAAEGFLAGRAGVAAVSRVACLHDLRFDALGLQRFGQLLQRRIGAALLVGAAVDQQCFHMIVLLAIVSAIISRRR